MYNATRNDLKQFASNIEALAKTLQDKLDKGEEYLAVANELVRNNTTLVITLGEVHALEQSSKSNNSGAVRRHARIPVKTTVVKQGTMPTYHNKRDALGRFARV